MPSDHMMVPDKSEVELQSLRDENDSLRQECQELRATINQHEEFMVKVSEQLPPSYDMDEGIEDITLHFLRDMQDLGRVVAKLTADYR